jgi:hypothetical protein
VASNNGADRDPAWWLKLAADRGAAIQIGSEHYRAQAHRAEG